MRRTLSVRADSTRFEFGRILSFLLRKLLFILAGILYFSTRVGHFGRRLALFGVC